MKGNKAFFDFFDKNNYALGIWRRTLVGFKPGREKKVLEVWLEVLEISLVAKRMVGIALL